MIGSNQTGSWWCKLAKVLTRPRSQERMQYLRECVEVSGEQQEDGHGFIQNIVTNLCEGSREGFTTGLREQSSYP